MNPERRPLVLPDPELAVRRGERPRPRPLDPERVQLRAARAEALISSISSLSQQLSGMSDQQRRAVFYKLEHDRPVELSGTDLKPLGEAGEHVTLAIPRADNLEKLQKKVHAYGTGALKKGQPANPSFDALQTVHTGLPTDRLSEGLFAQYETLVTKATLICEIEIISLERSEIRRNREIASIIQELEEAFKIGIEGNLFENERIKGTCRAVIRCTGRLFQSLVESPNWFRKIVWFEERPRFQTFNEIRSEFKVESLEEFTSPGADAPIVCVVDSGVSPQNPFLKPVCRQDLFKSFLKSDPENPFDGNGHGSGVASLVAYNALNLAPGAINSAKTWIASARITKSDNQLEDERLFSSVLKEVVEYFRPKGVRIYNLSVADPNMKWNVESKRTAPRKSWVARTIDRLSREHDVIFVTCTGNIPYNDISAYHRSGNNYPAYFCDEGARLLDPGQAALALTVGSIAPGTMVATAPLTAVADQNYPSPFTRSGPGIRREVKPEIVDFGGNYAQSSDGQSVLPNVALSVAMASHQLTPAVTFSSGTSFAAPRAAHKLALVQKYLGEVGISQPTSALLKALLVNSAMRRGDPTQMAAFSDLLDATQRNHWWNVLGYGFSDADRAVYCEDHVAILYYSGVLTRNQIAYFDVPVPAVLTDSGSQAKRLVVTVVSCPEVQRWGFESYLGTAVKWRMFRGDVDREGVVSAMSAEEPTVGTEGTVELSEENTRAADEGIGSRELKFDFGLTRRSRGVVQHDSYEWSRHRPEYSERHYTLAVAAFEKWGRDNPPVTPFAVVVRIEDSSRSIPVYLEVERLLAEIRIRTRG